MQTAEHKRLETKTNGQFNPWRLFGAYVSERQWGTVREDYSNDGDAWRYYTHDKARSVAYRWGEDGIAGFCDLFQTFVFSFAFWNGQDPILKERLFGLDHYEGNHAEDVKEYFFSLDATPTHSYLKYLYKYPQQAFPYEDLRQVNQTRTARDREYELLDTGIFKNNAYFDLFIEYAKISFEDIAIKLTVINRGEAEAPLTILPQIWFRNRWSWQPDLNAIPHIQEGSSSRDFMSLIIDSSHLPVVERLSYDYRLKTYYFYGAPAKKLLFTNNETNNEKIWKSKNRTPYVKDAFHRYVIEGEDCVNPKEGTKAAFYYRDISIPPNGSHVLYFRLSPEILKDPLKNLEQSIALRQQEADTFYASFQSKALNDEEKAIQRQALSGMIWNQQFYYYDVARWLEGDNPQTPPPPGHDTIRNTHWKHFYSKTLLAMPDKWEYPWFAAWDLSFHTLTLGLVDIGFAKEQLIHLFSHWFQHPNGTLPAYEWAFSDLNPPVQPWAVWLLYSNEGQKDRSFLEFCFLNMMRNFGSWVNRVDRLGNNVFEGGFLGLDNISVIDRSKPLPGGGIIEESDGTGWMGFYSLFMMRIALELAKKDPTYEKLAIVYLEHFVSISGAIHSSTNDRLSMWDEEDGFFYDVLSYPNGSCSHLKIRSYVGIIPFFSLDHLDEEELESFPVFRNHLHLFINNHQALVKNCIFPRFVKGKKKILLSLMSFDQMEKMFKRIFDPNEFYSRYGLRSLSKAYLENPWHFQNGTVSYEPGESLEKIKGGNSNWRGPIWFPINYLFIRSLKKLYTAFDSPFQIEVEGEKITLDEAANKLSKRLISLFKRGKDGTRPVHGDYVLFQTDPHWKDLLLFYEHYHGDVGRGLGANHQTGWSGLVANLLQEN